jgi:hypothetical protein
MRKPWELTSIIRPVIRIVSLNPALNPAVALAALGGDSGFGINVLNHVTGVGLTVCVHNHSNSNYGGPLTTNFVTEDLSSLIEFQYPSAEGRLAVGCRGSEAALLKSSLRAQLAAQHEPSDGIDRSGASSSLE